jgi:Tfp pilus assembly protein PilN
MPKNKAVNLLPQEEFNASTTGRILRWATGTFRVIVIATEMVVMGAFLSRFWLDAQNSNLNNLIKIKSAEISEQADLEKQFRVVQSKLDIFKKINQNQNASKYIERITGNVPQSIILSRISVGDGKIEVRGTSTSDYDIAQFIASLEGNPFKSTELGQISSTEGGFGATDFVINITY